MSAADKFPPLIPELAALLTDYTPPPADLPQEVIRAGEGEFFAETIKWQKETAPSEREFKLVDRKIPVDGAENLARIIIPTPKEGDYAETFPLFFWMHGGAYAVGSLNMDDFFLRRVAVTYRVVTVNIEYRLAPENPFPIGLNDAYNSLKWAVTNSASINASPALGFIVGGCSSGGNFAASIVLRARDDPLFSQYPITGQLLQIPQTIHPKGPLPEKYKSAFTAIVENAHAPFLSGDDVLRIPDVYKADATDPRYSVLIAPDHSKLPPAYMQVCGADPLRDDGLLYERALKEAGVPTKLDFYAEFPHGGHYMFPRLALSQRFYEDFGTGLDWLLQQTPKK